MKRRVFALLCILLVMSSFIFIVCSDNIFAQAKENTNQSQTNSLDELNGKNIGVQTGSINGPIAEARFPDSKMNYFNSQTDTLTALSTGKIDAWCEKNQIGSILRNRTQLVFEETMGLLVPALEKPRVQAMCEYSRKTNRVKWTICYGGLKYNPIDIGDKIALSLLTGIIEDQEYSFDESKELSNRLLVSVKK